MADFAPIPLYFIGTAAECGKIILQKRGFQDREQDQDGYRKGVLLYNSPLTEDQDELPDGMHAIEVILLQSTRNEVFYDFEITPFTQSRREFVVPANILNDEELCEYHPLKHDEIDLDPSGYWLIAWNDFPPGEPMRNVKAMLEDMEQRQQRRRPPPPPSNN